MSKTFLESEFPSLIDVDAAARLLGVTPNVLKLDRSRGSLGVPYVRLSERVIKYDAAELRAWLEARRRVPAPRVRRGRPTRAEQVEAERLGVSVTNLRRGRLQ